MIDLNRSWLAHTYTILHTSVWLKKDLNFIVYFENVWFYEFYYKMIYLRAVSNERLQSELSQSVASVSFVDILKITCCIFCRCPWRLLVGKTYLSWMQNFFRKERILDNKSLFFSLFKEFYESSSILIEWFFFVRKIVKD